jgi:hypothetical protein
MTVSATPSRTARSAGLSIGLVAAATVAAGLLATGCAGASRPPGALARSADELQSKALASQLSPSHVAQFLPHRLPATSTRRHARTRRHASTPEAAPIPVSGGSGSGYQPVAAGPGPCQASTLSVSAGPANEAAGTSYYPLEFTNRSAETCTMSGYPNVSFVSAPGGRAIGGPALRNPTFPKELVTLAPGATAHATLQVAIAENYPVSLCKPVTARWLQIFPPGGYTPRYLAFVAQTCTGRIPTGSTLGIYVVMAGRTGT